MAFTGKSYSITMKEEVILQFWNENNIFQSSIDNNKDNESFIFYDGPPFATGLPHYGHILAGYIKDTISRWATLKGLHVPRRAGFDCHGLPIEFEIEKKLGIKSKTQIVDYGIGKYNEACRSIVSRCADDWKMIMNRLGRWIDFDNGYKTMDLDYMSKVWGIFAKIYNKGLIYEGVKIMPYSTACTTPLSNFESSSNCQDVIDRTVIVKFKITDNKYILGWTTTPWTLPSHYCLCVNKNITYSLIEYEGNQYYISKSQIEFLKGKLKTDKITIINDILGAELVGMKYTAPYNFVPISPKLYTVVEDNFVTDHDGTGIVHIAPAFGDDDYRVCIKNNLVTKELSSLFQHIDDNGNGINCDNFNGLPFKEINKLVLKDLQKRELSMVIFDYEHRYPFCWRSDTPLIFKAVKCWFINVESIKDRMIEINKTINWVPEHIGASRFNNWLENTRDWCISRNRYWGTPIPIWKSEDGDILVVESKEHLEKLTNSEIKDIHRHNIDQLIINHNGKKYTREETVLDCWFESGCVPFASPTTGYPADFIAEGLDQTRGWFYTLLVLGTIIEDRTPYKNVIVNGIVLASDGRKMSKRLKNYPDPLDITNQYGADCLRYYLLMSGATMASELRFNNNDVKEVSQTIILPLTNSLSFYQEYYTFYTQTKEFKVVESDRPFDKWIMKKLYTFITNYSLLLNSYKINPIHELLIKFIDDLNNKYIRLNRDVIKGKDESDDGTKCLQALNTLRNVLYILSIYLSPILPFLAESIYQDLNRTEIISVHLTNINKIDINKFNVEDTEINTLETILNIIDMVRKIRNSNIIPVKKPLKSIQVYCDEEKSSLLKQFDNYILSECNIIDIEYFKWEGTKYKYIYNLNLKLIGKLFRDKRIDFETFMAKLTQEDLEKMYTGHIIKYKEHDITSDFVTILQVIEDIQIDNIKTDIDIYNRIKIKIDITSNADTEELFIAKTIATNFQRMRKYGGFHVYDNLKLLMLDNKFSPIIEKHMDYIMKTTRVPIEIVYSNTSKFNYKKIYEIDDVHIELSLLAF